MTTATDAVNEFEFTKTLNQQPRVATVWMRWELGSITYGVRPLPIDFSDKQYPMYFEDYFDAINVYDRLLLRATK